MKIFVFEYVTGGGLYREPLPDSLMHEGDLMLQTLLADLAEVPSVELITSRDVRLAPLSLPVHCLPVSPDSDFLQAFEALVDEADAVWLIAPESGNVLKQLSSVVVGYGKQLLGSSPQAIEIATSKSMTTTVLAQANIPVATTIPMQEIAAIVDGAWVAKPDDGAGCMDTCRFFDARELMAWLEHGNRFQTHVVQPFLSGEPASLSMLCRDGRAWLLSCNRQLVRIEQDQFSYHGSLINGMRDRWDAFDGLAQQVARAVPDLAGYVGVDLIVNGDELTVLEINPRLTTSYVGLRRAMACNPARLALDMFYNDAFELPQTMARNIVEISLDE